MVEWNFINLAKCKINRTRKLKEPKSCRFITVRSAQSYSNKKQSNSCK